MCPGGVRRPVSTDADGSEPAGLSPDEAFAALGDETRMGILRALGDAREPLAFSELRDRVGMRDSGQFNYHLDRLVGHFVSRSEDGYELRRAGERVVEAVLSGAVTQAPELGPTGVDRPCPYCGAGIEVRYREEELTLFCPECAGLYGERVGPEDHGLLGTLFLPPAGVEGRDPGELLEAAYTWGGLATMSAVDGVCPRCSAAVEESVEVCEDHDPGEGVCGACGGRYAASVRFRCTNCIYDRGGAFGVRFLTNTDLLAFLTARGDSPFGAPPRSVFGTAMDYEEEVRSTEPFEARFTFTAGGDALALTVGEDLSVVEVSEVTGPGAATE